MLKIVGMTSGYDLKKIILNNVNLELEAGKIVLLTGKSGIGKTTLLRSISGLHKPISGNVYISGNDVYKSKFDKRMIGYLSQDNALLNGINVIDNICMPAVLKNKAGDVEKIYSYGYKILQRFSLDEYAFRKVNNLSGGERRRIGIARALVDNPYCVLLDEPSNGLDDECVTKMYEMLVKLSNDGMLILISTHDSRLKMMKYHNRYEIVNGKLKENV